MSEKSETINAKRRLDLSSATTKRERTKVKNPYLEAPKSASTNTEEDATTKTSTITPEAGIDKFFVSKRKAGDAKPHAARKLVTPRENGIQQQDKELKRVAKGQTRKSLEFTSDDDTRDLYYHSAEDSHHSKKTKLHEAGNIHSILGYHHRGELPLDQGTLKAYRFIRNHFLIPRNIEADPKFGAHSGSCFEERVIRAYSLGQLKPKKSNKSECSLLVCSYCGDEGHKRDGCLKLL
mmetsp:Transcript_25373/g.54557  ORF Transcript_25373/g.54557 Transcript_25373/m.54557 type:complete len:236 (+) Transcript_25373:222-929(+)|eukprot:CAMPEP_0172312888 /NCGR_PEP_ID=MMETSP1058-20130122/18732_1 /TAXON_ID=83371 /ORGANISM="Detonula confervacea, Strain CCMP 353" /LENGTH=235 /DNA_ID=CAMNT_0013026443 /DNA_START=157 /DNA_END=864 /DNA_ORIENTATION=+